MKNIWTINIAGRLPMIRVLQFLSNPPYLVYFIKRFFWYKWISHRFIDYYDRFNFLTAEQTVKKLLKERLCLTRFSDGEIDLLTGMGVFDPNMSWSQPYSLKLKDAIKRSLKAEHPRLLIAHTSPLKFLATKSEASSQGISYTMWTDTRVHLHKYLSAGKMYGDAHSFIPNDNPSLNWDEIKGFLNQFNVVVVTGGVDNMAHLSLGKRTHFIEAGKHDAYSRYDQIMTSIQTVFAKEGLSKDDTLIMVSLGPTASVLAVDLTMKEYFVWDSGHIFKYAADKLA